jgi:hypothetical protein
MVLLLAVFFSSCQKYDSPADYNVEPSNNGRTVKTTRYLGKKWRDIKVPPRINGKRVVEIGENTFADFEIANVIIPNTIKKIGAWSFSGNYIREFTVPKSVTVIETGAFMINRLTSITIPKSVRKIGYRDFCENPLTRITIRKNVKLESIKGKKKKKEEDWVYYAFELGLPVEFDQFYEQNGRKAGTYVLTDGSWNFANK